MLRVEEAIQVDPQAVVSALDWVATHLVVKAQAASTPNALALICGSDSLTYSELDRFSDLVAVGLSHLPLGSRIGVLQSRSVHLATTLLGIWKAGHSYFPLDSLSPVDRLCFMVNDAEPAALLSDHTLLSKAERLCEKAKLLLLEEILNCEECSIAVQPQVCNGNSLAYTIYTSGSTGAPKGVLIEHQSLSNFLGHMKTELNVQAGERVFALAPVAFDAFVFELLLPLCSGATSVILPRSVASDADLLTAAIAKYRPRVMMATPATWQMLMSAGWKGASQLQCISGGEALSRRLSDYLYARTAAVWNHYGPTETTIAATSYRVIGGESFIALGKPVTGYELLILDENGDRVTSEQVGELYIGGIGLARGYLNRPEQTAYRFVECADASGQKRHFYRTGDLVRFAGGNLFFTGRADNQIKIRGLRIELEEIESVALQHPDVRQVAVVAKRLNGDDERLVSYVVGQKNASGLPESLRQFLSQKLPHYMVPAICVLKEELPTTGNGKIDRAALKAEPLPLEAAERSWESAPDELEGKILSLWRQLPHFRTVGLDDNFFQFGGHSLLGARLTASISQKLKLKLPSSVLFEAPTVRQLARFIRAEKQQGSHRAVITIRPGGTNPALFCIHGADGNVLGFECLCLHLPRGYPVYAVQATRLLLNAIPEFSIETLAAEYLRDIRAVQPTGPYLLAGYSAGGVVAFEMARQLMPQGEAVDRVFLLDSYMYPRQTERPIKLAPTFLEACARLRSLGSMGLGARSASFKKTLAHYRMIWGTEGEIRRFKAFKRLGLSRNHFHGLTAAVVYALDQYRPKPANVKVVLFRAEQGKFDSDDRYLGWAGLAAEFEEIEVEGEHSTMLLEPQVQSLARSIGKYLPAR